MNRRTALELVVAAATVPLAACRSVRSEADDRRTSMNDSDKRPRAGLVPSIFLAHGSPLLLDDAAWMKELRAWSVALPRPKSILMISAHWEKAPITVGATTTVPLVYDFYGFPQKYYDVTYPSPGAPELAQRVRELLAPSGPVADSPKRGLDHGAYIPLVPMYPDADVPVLQVSIPTMDPAALVELGRKLAPLRAEGVLIVGSGFLTHNMHAIDWDGSRVRPAWAEEFDAWNSEALAKRDVDALVAYRTKGPGVRMALPTHEHYVPVLVALGASIDTSEAATFPITGFTYGSFTKRSVQFG